MQIEKISNVQIVNNIKFKIYFRGESRSNSSDKIHLKKTSPIKYKIKIFDRKKAFSLKNKKEKKFLFSIKILNKTYKKILNLYSSKNYKKLENEIYNNIPWITSLTTNSKNSLKFHYEIFDFLNYITPTENENNLRFRTFYLLQNLIKKRWPNWKIQIYGSLLINLHLKDSDIDISIFKCKNMNYSNGSLTDYDDHTDEEMLYSIFENLVESKFSLKENTQLINAKVPIIKCICKETGIKIDIRYIN